LPVDHDGGIPGIGTARGRDFQDVFGLPEKDAHKNLIGHSPEIFGKSAPPGTLPGSLRLTCVFSTSNSCEPGTLPGWHVEPPVHRLGKIAAFPTLLC
jgi:hypothetical protein